MIQDGFTDSETVDEFRIGNREITSKMVAYPFIIKSQMFVHLLLDIHLLIGYHHNASHLDNHHRDYLLIDLYKWKDNQHLF
jgi:hypothetical protein